VTTINTISTGQAAPAVRKTGAAQALGKDAFLKILVTQLRNQDPLSPKDNSAFVAQMAQFTALEQMQNLNLLLGKLLDLQAGAQAPALLDRLVTVRGEGGQQTSGRVQAVEYSDGKPWLVVDGQRFGMGAVQKIAPAPGSEGQAPSAV